MIIRKQVYDNGSISYFIFLDYTNKCRLSSTFEDFLYDNNHYQWYKDKYDIEDQVQDSYNKQEKINTNLILINNIKIHSAYEFNLSSRKFSYIIVLDHESFDKI